MAKRKTPKAKKSTKLTNEELDKLQKIVNEINNYQIQIGRHETQKHHILHLLAGQEVYGGHTICDILEEKDKYSIYIRKNKDVLPWKDFNKNMAISIEYNLEY
jgi:uncharacterized membrane protein